ncbi:MAG TPA: aldo/keto reductase [Acidimicrobiales bacterium]|nr:aldo/keto reductase [Acidimicrobiales bacterium]
MEHRELGNSGIRLPVIGFGCGGNARLMVEDDEELRIATIRAALDAGISYFDTAAAYGDGRSESNLGRALRILDAHPTISTKVVLQEEDLADPRSAVLRNFEEGLARLGVDSVDALMLHNRVFHKPAGSYAVGAQLSLDDMFASNGVVAAFQELLAAGTTTTVGFTAYGGEPAAITELIDSGVFGALNASINLLDPSALVKVPPNFPEADYGAVAAYAAGKGMGVMAIQVLARGTLTGAGPGEGHAGRVAALARSYDESLPRAAARYVLGKAGVSTLILGLSEPAHVADAVAAVEAGPLSAAAIASLEELALTAPEREDGPR